MISEPDQATVTSLSVFMNDELVMAQRLQYEIGSIVRATRQRLAG